MSLLKAAIIDDGVWPELMKHSEELLVTHDLKAVKAGFDRNFCSHASDCITVINTFTDIDNIDWLNICVLDEESYTGSVERLLKALEICEEQNIKLIHMSIGSTSHTDFNRIKEITDRLISHGTVIVAAMSNSGRRTYPACIDGVIGVKKCEPGNSAEHRYIEDPFDGINFMVGSEHKLHRYGMDFVSQSSNSMAAPVITARVIDILKKDDSLDAHRVFDILKQNACAVIKDDRQDLFKFVSEDEIEMPVIGWYTSDTKTAEEVSALFKSDGYNSEVCAESYSGYSKIYGDNITGYFSAVREYCMCDILSAVFSDKEMFEKFKSFDIILTDKEQEIDIKKEIKSEIIDFNGLSAAEIYGEIMSRFDS